MRGRSMQGGHSRHVHVKQEHVGREIAGHEHANQEHEPKDHTRHVRAGGPNTNRASGQKGRHFFGPPQAIPAKF